jgi:uncharacterized membrane protein
MSSNQLDPRSMKDVEAISNYNPGLQPRYVERESSWVVWVQFAAVMLMLVGALHILDGLVALLHDDVFVAPHQQLVLDVDYTTWGWIHVVVGVIAVLVGVGLLSGRWVARSMAVGVAFLSVFANLGFLSAYPVWSVITITIDILVIWAIIVHGGELRPAKD